MRHRRAGRTVLVVTALVVSGCGAVDRSSVGVGGRQPSLPSSHPAISADGRYVAFVSAAPDVVPGDTNGLEDVFVHDHRTGRTERVSVSGDGTQGDGRSWAPTLSPDGRYVGFMTTATTFYAVGSTREPTVALHDRATDATTLAYAAGPDRAVFGSPQFLDSGHLSVTSVFRAVGGVPARTTSEATCFHAGPSSRARADGRGCVEPRPTAVPELGGGPGLAVWGVGARSGPAVLDTEITVDGAVPGGPVTAAWPSRSGRWVAFTSAAPNHVDRDGNGVADVFVVDRDPDGDDVLDQQTSLPVERVSVSSGGREADGACRNPSISGDGRYVVFESDATDLVGGDTNRATDVFRHDRSTGGTVRLSQRPGAPQADGPSTSPVVSSDGRHVAFASAATTLDGGDTDTNGVADVYRWTAPRGGARAAR